MGLSLNPRHSDYWTSGLTAGKEGHGKAVSQPACSSPLLACHLGLDSWLSVIPQGRGAGERVESEMPDTGKVF